MMIQQQTTL